MNAYRMIPLTVVAVLLSGGMAWAAGGAAPPQPQAQYSADSYTETSEMTLKERVYVAPGKQRKEQDMGGATQVSIIRMDKGVMWMLMPDDKMYMEMSLQQAQSRDPGVDLSAYQMERTEAGRESINGLDAIKYKIIMTGADGTKLGGFQWVVSPGIQIKLDALSKDKNSTERIKMELTNLQIGNQSPALFEIPEGYTKMTMPSLPGMGTKGLMENVPGFGR